MSKYNKEQLKEMARAVLEAKENDDPRYMFFVVNLGICTELSANTIEKRIEEIAKTGEYNA